MSKKIFSILTYDNETQQKRLGISLLSIIGVFVSVILCVMLMYVIITKSNSLTQSDAASDLVLPKLLSEENQILSRNWYYTTDIRIIHTQLIMTPLFTIFNDWATIRAVGNFILNLLMLSSYALLMRSAMVTWKYTLITMPLLIIPISGVWFDHVLFTAGYSPHIILLFIYLTISINLFYGEPSRATYRMLIVYFLSASLYCGIAGVRYIIVMVLPLLLSVFYQWFNDNKEFFINESGGKLFIKKLLSLLISDSSKMMRMAVLGLLVASIGYIINTQVLSQIYSFHDYNNIKTYNTSSLSPLDEMGQVMKAFLSNFPYAAGVKLFSLIGIAMVFVFIFIGLSACCVMDLWKNQKAKAGSRIIVLTYLFSLCVSTFALFIIGGGKVNRYYIPVIVLNIPMLAIYLNNEYSYFKKLMRGGGIILSMILFASVTLIPILNASGQSKFDAVIAALRDNELKFGYATFWNANVITEISDGEIEIASVRNFDKLSPHTWGSKKIYVDSNFNNHNKAVFILTTKGEANKFKDSKILLGGQLIYDANNYCLYKYASYEKLKALK